MSIKPNTATVVRMKTEKFGLKINQPLVRTLSGDMYVNNRYFCKWIDIKGDVHQESPALNFLTLWRVLDDSGYSIRRAGWNAQVPSIFKRGDTIISVDPEDLYAMDWFIDFNPTDTWPRFETTPVGLEVKFKVKEPPKNPNETEWTDLGSKEPKDVQTKIIN